MGELSGKVVVATGVAHGIGKATALLMARRGASLALADINEAGMKETAEECQRFGVEVKTQTVDQRSSGQVNDAIDAFAREFGRIDVIANIVGIYPFAFIENMTDEFWHNVLQVNLTGIFYWCRAVLPVMKRQQEGCIINVTSGGTAGLGAYAASKGGLTYFTQQALVAEAGPHGIRVNLVSPGGTDVGDPTTSGPDAEEVTATITNRMDSMRMTLAAPLEIAEVIAFLASDRAAKVHGANYGVNIGGPLGTSA